MANTEKKVTKRENLEAIIEIIKASDAENAEDLVAVVEKIIEQDANKAAKAKERAAEKKVAGDELRAKIEGLLTAEYQTADDIVEQINDPEVTKAKVVNRVGQLVKLGIAQKDEVKIGENKRMAYKLVDAE